MENKLLADENYLISTTPDEIVMGLFGGVTLFVFEILPYLESQSIFPAWNIRSVNYGNGPDYTIIPGVFDLAYEPNLSSLKEIKLSSLRRHHVRTLGNDWVYLNRLWTLYFKIPERIIDQANNIEDLSETLGLHYRGTDKKTAAWDTNGVSQEDYITLVKDFLKNHSKIFSVFIATDEISFVKKFREEIPSIRIINLGEVEFHLNLSASSIKGDRALLDCLLLSRCKYVINTSSALSAFSKVLNPDLECYRVAASKLFGEMPYFPIAYIPKLTSNNLECQKILTRLFEEDWLQNKRRNKKYETHFATHKRSKVAILKWNLRKKFATLIFKVKNKIFPGRIRG